MMLLQIIALCVSTFVVTAQHPFHGFNNGQCREGWTYKQGSCYVYGDIKSTWSEAQTFCTASGGTLLEIESSSLNVDFKSEAMHRKAECVWMGGVNVFKQISNFIQRAGSWKWISTGNTIAGFADWAEGQPNNMGPGPFCAGLAQAVANRWGAFPCNYTCNFICQHRG